MCPWCTVQYSVPTQVIELHTFRALRKGRNFSDFNTRPKRLPGMIKVGLRSTRIIRIKKKELITVCFVEMLLGKMRKVSFGSVRHDAFRLVCNALMECYYCVIHSIFSE